MEYLRHIVRSKRGVEAEDVAWAVVCRTTKSGEHGSGQPAGLDIELWRGCIRPDLWVRENDRGACLRALTRSETMRKPSFMVGHAEGICGGTLNANPRPYGATVRPARQSAAHGSTRALAH